MLTRTPRANRERSIARRVTKAKFRCFQRTTPRPSICAIAQNLEASPY
jgi:hypothetical protein